MDILWKDMTRKANRLKLCRNCAFVQNCHTWKLGEITVFYAMLILNSVTMLLGLRTEKSCSHWKCTSGLQRHMIFVCLYALFSCMPWFHVCIHVWFCLISNVQIVSTKIQFQFKHSKNDIMYVTVTLVT